MPLNGRQLSQLLSAGAWRFKPRVAVLRQHSIQRAQSADAVRFDGVEGSSIIDASPAI